MGRKGGYSVSTVRRMKSIFAVLNKLIELTRVDGMMCTIDSMIYSSCSCVYAMLGSSSAAFSMRGARFPTGPLFFLDRKSRI